MRIREVYNMNTAVSDGVCMTTALKSIKENLALGCLICLLSVFVLDALLFRSGERP
jgi:hypothetical protein